MSQPAHWSDIIAKKIIAQKGDKDSYTLAAGITPSGMVHIGNFRELITVDFVYRSLKKLGKKVRFIFSWDDYDVFRKVPQNMPKQQMLASFLKKPITEIPDPFGEFDNYAIYHEKKMENSIQKVGITPEFIYQSKKYKQSNYAKEIICALENKDIIQEILNQNRKAPLAKEWLPISVFCEKCRCNDMDSIAYKDYFVIYQCSDCSHYGRENIYKTSNVKLLWRIDWPMRWKYENVDFEPGGKDHSSQGGSHDTAKEISKKVYNFEPPVYQMYDFVSIKGQGGKISSSSGEVVTLDDLLEIYEPEITRWIFSSYRTNVEFSISFDLDVLKIYEDFDRAERRYFGLEEISEKQKTINKRSYELAQVKETNSEKYSYRPAFRHFCNIIQICDFDYEKTKQNYIEHLKNDIAINKFNSRFKCASNWIKLYAPEDFCFQLNTKPVNLKKIKIPDEILSIIQSFKKTLEHNWNEAYATQFLYGTARENEVDLKELFRYFYLCLINKEKGPKLIPFVFSIGKEKILRILDV